MWNNRLFQEMDRFFGRLGVDLPRGVATPYPPLNVWEDADFLYVEAELPGLRQEEIDINVSHGDTLTISGERQPRGPEKAKWLKNETGYGRFTRTVTLPSAVDSEKIEAVYETGVLSIALPKHEAAKARKIAVKTHRPAPITDGAN